MREILVLLIFIFNGGILFAQSVSDDYLYDDSLRLSLRSQYKLSEFDSPDIVLSFNKDTILIVGYLADNSIAYNSITNVVYRTLDGGLTWKLITFDGDAWIYCAHIEKNGKVWMGGSDEFMHYSDDFGATWTRLPKPFKPNDRVLSICMVDSLYGVAGGLSNGLAITKDNWITSKQIQSPLDQHKFEILDNSARNDVRNIALLDSVILISQNDHVYYSRIDKIKWKEFNIPVKDFSLDQTKKQWSIYSVRNKVYVLSSRLDLLYTYYQAEEYIYKTRTFDSIVDLQSFFASEIKKVRVKSVNYEFDKMVGQCLQRPVYKANVQEMKITDEAKIVSMKETLLTSEYSKPLLSALHFTSEDFKSYEEYYNEMKEEREDEKTWGGDFTYQVNIEGEYFKEPQKTIANLNQALLDSVYKMFRPYTNPHYNQPWMVLSIVDEKSDTLKITSDQANLFSLPWTIEYKGKCFITYDTRITEYFRAILPKDNNYYNKLLGGELIYRLVEQQTINELKYENGY